jgi:hypothetical protein
VCEVGEVIVFVYFILIHRRGAFVRRTTNSEFNIAISGIMLNRLHEKRASHHFGATPLVLRLSN